MSNIEKQQAKILEYLEQVVEQQREIIEKLTNLDLPGADFDLEYFDPDFEGGD